MRHRRLAVARWQASCPGVPALAWDDAAALDDARRFLQAARADALLSAAGVCNQIEHTFRLAAREVCVRSVAVLDFWGRYADRFRRTRDSVESVCHPDVICAPDEVSRAQMIVEGFAPESILVTGLPHMEQAMCLMQSITPAQRCAWRERYGVPGDDLALVFFSDFLEQGYNVDEHGRLLLGYNQQTTWQALSRSLDAVNRAAQRRIHLLVKPHLLEDASILQAAMQQTATHGILARLVKGADAHELIAVADIVVGMISTLLFEAALIGKPALSVQIGLLESGYADPLISNELGYTIPIYDELALSGMLRQVVSGQLTRAPQPRHPVSFEGATRRVINVILEQMDGAVSSD